VAPRIERTGDEGPKTVDRDDLADSLFRAMAGDV
jgi:hypothetical protein